SRRAKKAAPQRGRLRSINVVQATNLLASREFEAADAGAPVERAGVLQVLVGVPESAVVHRINRHAAVVTPAIEVAAALRAAAIHDARFRAQGAERVAGKTAGVADRRIHRA